MMKEKTATLTNLVAMTVTVESLRKVRQQQRKARLLRKVKLLQIKVIDFIIL